MDNKDNRNEISNELEQHCDNKESLKVDQQIKLQKKCTKQVKLQDSLCGSKLNYEHNEEPRNLWSESATHEKQKGVPMVVVYLTSSCVNWGFLARVGQFETRMKRAF
jgi:hypothetical protein